MRKLTAILPILVLFTSCAESNLSQNKPQMALPAQSAPGQTWQSFVLFDTRCHASRNDQMPNISLDIEPDKHVVRVNITGGKFRLVILDESGQVKRNEIGKLTDEEAGFLIKEVPAAFGKCAAWVNYKRDGGTRPNTETPNTNPALKLRL